MTALARLAAAAGGAILAIGCGGAAAGTAPLPLLRLGLAVDTVPAQPNSVLWLAKDDGFYQREGVDVDLVQVNGTPLVLDGLVAGNLDVGNVSTEATVRLAALRPHSVVAISSPDPRSYFVIASRGSVASLAGLRGRTLAVSARGGLDDLATSLVLDATGVGSASIHVVPIGDPQARVQALILGQVDAVTVAIGTWLTISQRHDLKLLMDERQFFDAAPVLAKVNAVTPSTLASKRAALVRFTAALLRATRHYAENRDAWVKAMARRRSDLGQAQLTALWDHFQAQWPVDGGLDLAWCRATADALLRTAAFSGLPRVPLESWTDPSVLRAALAAPGVRTAGMS
jgi:NitT/TauT family transport system substrate-binding protein